MHLLPQSFEFAGNSLLLPELLAGTAALLLPAAVRFFSKSLPHLLPRRAFSFLDGRSSKPQIKLWCLAVLLRVEGRERDAQKAYRPFEREDRRQQRICGVKHHLHA